MLLAPALKVPLAVFACVGGLYGSLWVAAGVWDGTTVASRLSAQAGGVMQCVDGRLVYADDALLTRLTTDGRFQCTEWKITDGPDRR
ncbi:MAG: hypothetical protein E6H79_12615 [Betaproteobacteria bacterium]|nr:MAG: hypothetical protein E6H79_12615 [Betaproteobacteria bacterium]